MIELAHTTLTSGVSHSLAKARFPTGFEIVRGPMTAAGAAGLSIGVAHHDAWVTSSSSQAKRVKAPGYARASSIVAYSEAPF